MTDPINLEIQQVNQNNVCLELAEAGAPAGDQTSTGCISDSTKDEDDYCNPEYRTADFRMYCFKVLPCSKEHPHRWTNCPFAHEGEHACRRDPRKYDYSAVVCPDLLQTGSCPRGDACNSAHSVFEFWLHPQRYRTQICREGPGCQRRVCFFAHSEDELREVQLPPVEDGVDPFATAKMAKYSMASIPEKRKLSRSASASKTEQKQQQATSTSPSKQSGRKSGSPTNSSKGAAAAEKLAAAVSAAATLSNALSQPRRTSSDTARRRSSSSTSTAQQQQHPQVGQHLRAGGVAAAAGGPVRSRGRLSMDAACWMNRQQSSTAAAATLAEGADARTRRRYSLESALQRSIAAASGAQGPWNATEYLCSNTMPLPGCNGGSSYASMGGPTVHMALPPRAGVQSLPPAHLGAMLPRGPAACGAAAPPAAAACSGNSPSQWMLQQALQQQQQQYTACLTDMCSSSLSNQTLDYSSASMPGCGSADLSGASGPLQTYSMEGIYSSSAMEGIYSTTSSEQSASSKQLPQLMILRQNSMHDAAAAAAAEAWQQQQQQPVPLTLQLMAPATLSLNATGPHAGSSTTPHLPIAQGVYMTMQQLQQQQQGGPALWYTGAALQPVQQGLDPAAAGVAAGVPSSSPFVAALPQDQPAHANLILRSTSLGSNAVLPSCSPGGSTAAAAAAAGGVVGVSPAELWSAGAAATAGSGWGSTNRNLGLPGSGLQAAGSQPSGDLAAQLQQLQMDVAAPADLENVFFAYQAAATACRERAQQAKAAADAANERLLACVAALTGNTDPTATNAAAAVVLSSGNQQQQQQQQQIVLAPQPSGSYSLLSSSSMGSGGVAGLPSPHHDVAAVGGPGLSWSPSMVLQQQQQQQLLPSEQLMMLLDE